MEEAIESLEMFSCSEQLGRAALFPFSSPPSEIVFTDEVCFVLTVKDSC